MPDNNELSERELEILRLVATGASNKQIAQKLIISTNTVKVHLKNIFGKIGVASRTEAAMYAVKAGLIQADQISAEDLSQEESQNIKDLESSHPGEEQSNQNQGLNRMWMPLIVIGLILVAFVSLWSLGILLVGRADPIEAQPLPTPRPRWEARAPMTRARFGMASAVYADQIYLIGGEDEREVLNLNERYDPSTDRWTILAPKPHAVTDVQAGVVGGKIYIPGGRLGSGTVTDILEIYNPLENVWQEGTRLPTSLSAYALAAFEGKLYLFGGWDGTEYVSNAYAYDPSLDRWVVLPQMPTARGYAGAVVVGRKIYVFGGYDGKSGVSVNEALLPDIPSGSSISWESEKPLPESRFGMGVTNIADLIYVLGGQSGSNNQFPFLTFSHQSEDWGAIDSIPGELGSNLSLVNISTYLFFMGGKVGNSAVSTNMAYKAIYTISIPIITK
jgi:DNA-binding CsgD family transcriptional regulator